MVYRVETEERIEAVKASLPEKAQQAGFGILKEYAFKTLLKEKGFPIDADITVYELCNPKAAQAALRLHPEISVYLPCRISLYEENGKTVITTIGLDEILQTVPADESFKAEMEAIFTRLKALMASWE